MRVVHNIILDSDSIIGVLRKTGLSLKQIAAAAPRLQASIIFFFNLKNDSKAKKKSNKKLKIFIRHY